MTHQVVRRCTSALLPLNGSVQGGHYPQGARRIRKAAKPPTGCAGSAATDAIGGCVFIDTLHELEVPSRDCHVALLLAMTHQVVRRCTSALLPLNGSVQGGHYPQGARRIRKAAKPPTAAQGAPLQTQSVGAFYRHLARTGSAFPRLPRRFAPRNDDLGECRGAPAPLHGLIPLYKALATRKGHAASVRRQSRQRLRRERRYSQIWQRVRSAMACTGGNCLPEIATSLCSSQ